MLYVTAKQNRKPHQLNFEDILLDKVPLSVLEEKPDISATVTKKLETVPDSVDVNVGFMIRSLQNFNERHKDLFEKDRDSLYSHYKIPKKTGGWRPIDAPCNELQSALGELAGILTDEFGMLYHTAAFAYVKNRCIIDALKKHSNFKSNWFLKTDISGFFPHTTLEYAMHMLGMIFPTSEIVKRQEGKEALEKALSLGFLNGGLPQGTCLSPCLTNILFIPIDHYLFNQFSSRALIYTRYADDMYISGRENFPYKTMVDIIKTAFEQFGAPYIIKDEKTHYGSVKGNNWCLGLMLNGEYNITIGYRNKKYFKGMLNNFILDTKNRKPWDLDEVHHLSGLLSYYRMVEKDYFDNLIRRMNTKNNVNVDRMIKEYFKAA